jgi:hypothetical protein
MFLSALFAVSEQTCYFMFQHSELVLVSNTAYDSGKKCCNRVMERQCNPANNYETRGQSDKTFLQLISANKFKFVKLPFFHRSGCRVQMFATSLLHSVQQHISALSLITEGATEKVVILPL